MDEWTEDYKKKVKEYLYWIDEDCRTNWEFYTPVSKREEIEKECPTVKEGVKLLLKQRRKASKIREALNSYFITRRQVYFLTLTFNDFLLEGYNIPELRRKARERLKNNCFAYTYIEEYGEENNRYHIHAICLMKDNNWLRVKTWLCRQNIKKVKNDKNSLRKLPRYLAKYMSKQLSRIHTCKQTVKMVNEVRRIIRLERVGFKFPLNMDLFNEDSCL